MGGPVLTRYTIPNTRGIRLRIAVVADLHDEAGEEALELLRQAEPELILLPGDLLERVVPPADLSWSDIQERYRQARFPAWERRLRPRMDALRQRRSPMPQEGHGLDFLRQAAQIAPAYLSLGNHEFYLRPRDFMDLAEAGGVLLDNRAVTVHAGDGMAVRLGGLSTRPDEGWLADFAAGEGYKILLCHHPEYYEPLVRPTGIELTVSGHAHGGQIRLLGRGVYAPGQGLFPKYTRGVYDGGRLVVSAGLHSTAGLPRWGNPTEVVLVELEPEGSL
ncbi:MAG: metallophosphoesterase [Clostridiales bacterium]|nr:metallophosphoesterase [Clostridiales bacterium]